MLKWFLYTFENAAQNWVIHALLLVVVTAASAGNGQQSVPQSQKPLYGNDPASVPIAISRVEKGDFAPVDVEVIARWHAVQATPLLEIQFERSKDPYTKGKIANALVRLGIKDGPYWEFLVEQARQILQDEPPTPIDYDAKGAARPDQPSKKFVEWANKHHMSVEEAFSKAMFGAAGVIVDLGSSDDARAIPILRQALTSQNQFIEMQAALGLAELHDTESVPTIINACENAPKEAASAIARSLVYFDDPAAQRAVDAYVPKDIAQNLREARAHGKTPYR
jgi:hypothetical protein